MNALVLIFKLFKLKTAILLAKASQLIAPSALRADEVQPEIIDIGAGLCRIKLCTAANAFPHGSIVSLASLTPPSAKGENK